MVRITRLRRIGRVSIWRRVVLRPLSMIDRRAHLPLPALLLNGHFRVDAPIEAFAFFVALDKSVVLSKVMPDTGLPTTRSCLELVPGVFLLDVVVDLLEIHLASRRGRDGLMNEHNIIGRRTLQLFFGIVLDAHLRRRRTRRFDRLLLLRLVTHQCAIALLSRFQNIVAIYIPGVRVLAFRDLGFDGWRGYIGGIDTSGSGPFDLFGLLDQLRALSL